MEVLTAQRGREIRMGWATWPIDMFAVLHKSGYLEKAYLIIDSSFPPSKTILIEIEGVEIYTPLYQDLKCVLPGFCMRTTLAVFRAEILPVYLSHSIW